MKQQLLNELTELFKSTLNKNSKFFAEDLADFKKKASTKNEKELNQLIANMRGHCGRDKKVNRIVSTELNRMDKAGMFDVKKLSAVNALKQRGNYERQK